LQNSSKSSRAARAGVCCPARDSRDCTENSTWFCHREEFAIEAGIVEAGHRTAGEAERTRRDDQIGALQARIAGGILFDFLGSGGREFRDINMRRPKCLWKARS
jgi:hypothetical protein